VRAGWTRGGTAALAVAVTLAVTGCGSNSTSGTGGGDPQSSARSAGVTGSLTVFAAASLTESFT